MHDMIAIIRREASKGVVWTTKKMNCLYVHKCSVFTFTLCTCVDLKLFEVAAIRITQAPDLEPSLDRLFRHVLLQG